VLLSWFSFAAVHGLVGVVVDASETLDSHRSALLLCCACLAPFYTAGVGGRVRITGRSIYLSSIHIFFSVEHCQCSSVCHFISIESGASLVSHVHPGEGPERDHLSGSCCQHSLKPPEPATQAPSSQRWSVAWPLSRCSEAAHLLWCLQASNSCHTDRHSGQMLCSFRTEGGDGPAKFFGQYCCAELPVVNPSDTFGC
jgi:hypothetical protein